MADPKAIEDIRRLIALYGPLLDDHRLDEWGALFTEGAKFATSEATFSGRDAIVKGIGEMGPRAVGDVKHTVFAPVVDFETKERALVWSDFVALARAEDGGWTIHTGRYYDVVVFDGDRWRFDRRHVRISGAPAPAGMADVPAR